MGDFLVINKCSGNIFQGYILQPQIFAMFANFGRKNGVFFRQTNVMIGSQKLAVF
jgi:hypothetical protein